MLLICILGPSLGQRETNVRLINHNSNDYTDYFPDNDSEN